METEAKVLMEVYLMFHDERSYKGYISQVIDTAGQFSHITRWGGVGKSFQTKEDPYSSSEAAHGAHSKVIQGKVAKGYRECEPELLGFERGEATQSVAVAIPEVEWTPMLFDRVSRARLEEFLTNDGYFAQRKMNGERRRLHVTQTAAVTGYNRRGIQVPVPAVLRLGMQQLLENNQGRPIDLDGEVIGNNQFYAFDWLNDPALAAVARLQQLQKLLATQMILGVYLTPAAMGTEGKRALYDQAVREGWEGLMFKRQEARYFRGRSAGDFKLKFWNDATVLLVGVNQTAKREIGSFQMVWPCPDGRMIPVGNVSTGTTEAQRQTLAAQIEQGPVLVDVRYLYYDKAALYQATLPRGVVRTDVTLADLAHQKVVGMEGAEIVL